MNPQINIKEYSVKKVNYLVPFEERMTKESQLCVSFLISSLPHSAVEEDGFPVLKFSFNEIKKEVNADGKRRVTEVKDLWNINSELMFGPLWYDNEDKQGMVSWMTEVSMGKKTNEFVYSFHPKLDQYLLNL